MPIDNIQKYETYRKQYPVFVYDGFDVQDSETEILVNFRFEIIGLTRFSPSIKLFKKNLLTRDVGSDLDVLLFHIGMVEAISYWKTTCSPVIRLGRFVYNESQILFWKRLFYNGLGEFFYLNGLSPNQDELFEFEFLGDEVIEKHSFEIGESVIVPIGGGKDSSVTLQTLIDGGYSVMPFILNSRLATEQTVVTAGISMDDVLEVKRTIDENLLRLNKDGFLNGHTPFSALLAFITVFVAVLSGRRFIALSNESSANEPTIPGTNINHQYSKSLEFENDFRAYLASYITEDVNYFSFLRPLSELQIAAILAKYDKYLSVFKSCNVGSKTDIWCGACPKCLFTFIMLLPFLDYERIVLIFGKDMLEDVSLKIYFEELTGISNVKPFECVGTIDEVNLALSIFSKSNKYNKIPALIKYYIKVKDIEIADDFFVEMKHFELKNNLPKEMETLLKLRINEL